MADHEQKGLDLMAQAEKKAKSTGGFLGGLFGTGSSKLEESAELYCRAGNSFKMGKKWAAAGDAYCRAAQVQIKMNSRHEAATQYVNASTCFKKADPNEAINCLLKAIEIYTDMGRFTMAAKHHISIAEMYETEVVDIDKAMANYEQAADYYKGEESTSSANKCSLKVAQYAAQLEQYEKAIEIYEQVATSSMDNQLLRYGAKDYFFRAALCHLCVEILNGANAIQRYKDMFPAFADSRESKLLEKLVSAGDEQNVDAFTEAVQEYDRISRLDQWHTTILLRVKKHVEGEPDLR